MLPRIDGRNVRLAAEQRDQDPVDVPAAHPLTTVAEQELRRLPGLRVHQQRLGGADPLPGGDRLADRAVDRLGEREPGLVSRHVQQADGVLRERSLVHRAGGVLALPAEAADAQAGQLIHP